MSDPQKETLMEKGGAARANRSLAKCYGNSAKEALKRAEIRIALKPVILKIPWYG